jgi:hypothetical protein
MVNLWRVFCFRAATADLSFLRIIFIFITESWLDQVYDGKIEAFTNCTFFNRS